MQPIYSILSKAIIAIASIQAVEPAAAKGLFDRLLAKDNQVHALQLEQAVEAELVAHAHICRDVGGTPAEAKLEAAQGAEARGLMCQGSLAYRVRILMEPVAAAAGEPDAGEPEAEPVLLARQVVELSADDQPLDATSLVASLRHRHAAQQIPSTSCAETTSERLVRVVCVGPQVAAVATKFLPNRFAPWTDVAKQRRAAYEAVFGAKK